MANTDTDFVGADSDMISIGDEIINDDDMYNHDTPIVNDVVADVMDEIINKVCCNTPVDSDDSIISASTARWGQRTTTQFEDEHPELICVEYTIDSCTKIMWWHKNQEYEEITMTAVFEVKLENDDQCYELNVDWLCYDYYGDGVVCDEPEITTECGDTCVCLKNRTWYVVKNGCTERIVNAARLCGDTEYVYKTLTEEKRQLQHRCMDITMDQLNNIATIQSLNSTIEVMLFCIMFLGGWFVLYGCGLMLFIE